MGEASSGNHQFTCDGQSSNAANIAVNAKEQAFHLLGVLAEVTRVEGEPRIVTDLRDQLGLSTEELGAAWRYLKDHRLIDAFRIPLSARIHPRGVEALELFQAKK